MDMVDALRYLGALALVLALIGAAGLALRRYGLSALSGSGRRLCVMDSLMLGRNQRAVILRCDGVEYVVVVTPQGASLLASQSLKAQPERVAA